MASEVKANKLSPSSGTALQIGDASDTITIPTGATFTITDGLGVAAGGTGLSSFTAGDVLYATGTTTLAKLAKGTAEQVLAMNSGATAPDWGSVDLTVLPTITAVKGGTGQTSFTAGDIFYANSTTTITKLAKGTGLQGLQTNSGATAPEWAASPQSVLTAAGDILYASGANTLAKLAKGSDDEVLTLASGVPSWAESAGGGKIGQVKQAIKTDTYTSSSTSYVAIPDLEIAITPAASTSKVLISTKCNIFNGGSYGHMVDLFRDIGGGGYASLGFIGDTSSTRTRCSSFAAPINNTAGFDANINYLDSPSTTSECTYKIYGLTANSSPVFYLNREGNFTDTIGVGVAVSSITVMEVLA